jgi:hypothetical protein
MNYTWLPATLRRIADPVLQTLSDSDREAVEAALEAIRRDPYDPPFPGGRWRAMGKDALPNTFVVMVDNRFVVRYQVMRDLPLIGLVNLLDFRVGGPYGPTD